VSAPPEPEHARYITLAPSERPDTEHDCEVVPEPEQLEDIAEYAESVKAHRHEADILVLKVKLKEPELWKPFFAGDQLLCVGAEVGVGIGATAPPPPPPPPQPEMAEAEMNAANASAATFAGFLRRWFALLCFRLESVIST